MHLADGVVTQVPLVLSLNLLGACGVGGAASSAFRHGAKGAAWTGTLAAFVLAVQALNLPILPGASAHVIGAGLLALALGPARAIVAGFAVLLVQALLWGDGGVTVLGVNALDMAVLPALAVHGCRRLFGESPRGLALAAVFGVTLGNVLGACSLSLALVAGAGAASGITFAWLIGVQGVAGLAEGTLTALAVRSLLARAPALVHGSRRESAAPPSLDSLAEGPRANGNALRVALIAVGVVIALLPLASARPDVLEVVLAQLRAAR